MPPASFHSKLFGWDGKSQVQKKYFGKEITHLLLLFCLFPPKPWGLLKPLWMERLEGLDASGSDTLSEWPPDGQDPSVPTRPRCLARWWRKHLQLVSASSFIKAALWISPSSVPPNIPRKVRNFLHQINGVSGLKYFRTETDQSIQGYSSSLHGLIFIFNLAIFCINRFRNNHSHSILSVYHVPDALYRKSSLNVVDRLYTFKQKNVQQKQFSHRPIDMNKNEVPITSHQHNEGTRSETTLFMYLLYVILISLRQGPYCFVGRGSEKLQSLWEDIQLVSQSQGLNSVLFNSQASSCKQYTGWAPGAAGELVRNFMLLDLWLVSLILTSRDTRRARLGHCMKTVE